MFNRVLPAALLLTSLSSLAQVSCPKPNEYAKSAFKLIEANEAGLCAYLQNHLVSKTAMNEKCETMYLAAIRSANKSALNCLDSIGFGPRSKHELNEINPQLEMSLYQYTLENGNLETILKLKKAGGKIEGNEFLSIVKNKNTSVVSYFIRQGADVNATDDRGATAIMHAAASSSKSVLELMIRAGANVLKKDSNNNTAIFYAIDNADLEVMRFLVAQGVDIDAKNAAERSAFWFAARNKSTKLLETMIRLGAEINIKDFTGRTPLHQAILGNKVANVDLLIQAGADLHAVANGGENALMLNAMLESNESSLEIAKLLLKYGIEINQVDEAGYNALHLLADSLKDTKNEKIAIEHVRLLHRAGIDLYQPTTSLRGNIPAGSIPRKVAQIRNLSPAIIAEFK